MEINRTYYNYCVDVLSWSAEEQKYVLWFVARFSSKRNFEIWRNGFWHGLDMRKSPFYAKLGNVYVKYTRIKPNF